MQIRKATMADADKITRLLTHVGCPGTRRFMREKIVRLNSRFLNTICAARLIKDGAQVMQKPLQIPGACAQRKGYL